MTENSSTDTGTLLQRVIERGRSFCGMPRLSDEQLEITADDWSMFLRANRVPPNRYWDCFENFMCSGERATKFTVYDLRDAWLRIKSSYQVVKNVVSEDDRLCGGCYGTGWASNELVETDEGWDWRRLQRDGNDCVRPCVCRKGRQFDSQPSPGRGADKENYAGF